MTPLAGAFTAALIDSLWQDLVVWAALLAVLSFLRSPSARMRYRLSCAALTLMAVVPLITTLSSTVPAPARIDRALAATNGAAGPAEAAQAWGVPGAGVRRAAIGVDGLMPYVLPLWCAGVLLCSLRFAGSVAHTARLRRRVVPPEPGITALVSGVAARMGLTRLPRVAVSVPGCGPAVVGWFRPLLLLAPATLLQIPPAQLEALVAHELAHLRRHDYLVNAMQMVVETLFFYHPAVWLVSRRIRAERELCCDDLAVACCGDPVLYARALIAAARIQVAPPPAVAATRDGLRRRVERLLGVAPAFDAPRPLAGVFVTTVVLVAIATGPVWGDAQGGGRTGGGGVSSLAGTVYDPLGRPAEDTIITLIGMGGLDTRQARSDAIGHYRFDTVPAGQYGLTTPISDIVDPPIVQVRAGQAATVDIHISVDETAVNMRVCGDCAATVPAAAAAAGDRRVTAITGVVRSAQPIDGWEAFNAAVFAYPETLKAVKTEGTVAVEAQINPDGTTSGARVTSAPNAMLADAAIALVQQQRWQPALVRGVAVAVPLHVTVEYSRRGDDLQ